jgi:uncharacterized membrane protein YdjX (TVP38/TMEM64 family)
MKRPHPSLLWLLLALLVGILLPFALWGEALDAALSLEGARAWMLERGELAWAAGVVLLVADLLLPIPSTVVMSALGWIYGWLLGGVLAAVGSMLAGITAHALSRWWGRGVARWLAGEQGLARAERLFATHGGWLVALSRWMPVLPEAVACLAGLARMRWSVFLASLACGSVPAGFAFAAIGHLGQQQPGWAVALSTLTPLLLWFLAVRWRRRAEA